MSPPGNTCPYCRSPVASAENSKECPSCGAAHHADCWEENGGCAVIGCASGPKPTTEAPVVLPPIEEPAAPAMVVDVDAEGDGGGGGKKKWSRSAVIAAATVAVVAMAGIGVAFAIALRDDSGGLDAAEIAELAAEEDEASRRASTQRREGGGGPRDSSQMTEAEAVRGAEKVLLRHHRFLRDAEGDSSDPDARRAFALISARKRAYEEADDAGLSGFEFWISKNESENLAIGSEVCLPGTVQLDDPENPGYGFWDPATGEAMVFVDYGSYDGYTWALYENGHWTYDPGYGHVDSRRAQWESDPTLLFSRDYSQATC